MKAPLQLPRNLRVIEREGFLSAVERRGHALLRAQCDNPGNHLLVLFCDEQERYVVILEVGPGAALHDLKQALANGPAGLSARYIVPCAQCPPYALPKGLPVTALPVSLAPLSAPPEGFVETPAKADEKSEPVEEPEPVPAASGSMHFVSPRAPLPPPVTKAPAKPALPPQPPAATNVSAGASAPAEAGSLAAMLAKSLQDIERNLAEREAEVVRREQALAEREREVAEHVERTGKERDELRQEAMRLNEELESREIDLFRREADLKSRAEAIVRALREVETARQKIESLAGRHQ